MIGLLAREGFNIEPTAVEDAATETQPLESDIQRYKENDSGVHSSVPSIFPNSLLNVTGGFINHLGRIEHADGESPTAVRENFIFGARN
ncbi:hypothetical protein NQ318_001311 [Aromia moschata]|uniref:Uncharacterized protein n=1 Tax=Aromia moschata TaxID=1265417 RepID=A0AAV8ZG45_9CUCU|nr:hypothetical protein NQ318_001311 [Aromia moschata]